MRPTFDELKTAAEPLIDLLNKFGYPYASIVVSANAIEINETTMRLPLEIKD